MLKTAVFSVAEFHTNKKIVSFSCDLLGKISVMKLNEPLVQREKSAYGGHKFKDSHTRTQVTHLSRSLAADNLMAYLPRSCSTDRESAKRFPGR